jgi:hypothetical protein
MSISVAMAMAIQTISHSQIMRSLLQAKPYTGTDPSQIRDVLLPYFENLDAYPNTQFVKDALNEHYKLETSSTTSTAASTVPNIVRIQFQEEIRNANRSET